MLSIKYHKGDATDIVVDSNNKILAHVCNDIGAWGAGFVLALSRKWPQTKKEYLSLNKYKLGSVQFVDVRNDLVVANMIAQHSLYSNKNKQPINYSALTACLNTVRDKAIENNSVVHMPKIGCGLARGDWKIVSDIVEDSISSFNIQVIVWSL